MAAVGTVVALLIGVVGAASPAHASRGSYIQLVNAINGKCADVAFESKSPGEVVHLWDCQNHANQLWLPVDLFNGYFQYVNMNSGLCLNVVLTPRGTGVGVVQQSCDGGQRSQWWRWLGADDIGHLVLNSGIDNGNWCMALAPYSSKNGAYIGTMPCATTSGQMWSAG
jgi:galactose oxidase